MDYRLAGLSLKMLSQGGTYLMNVLSLVHPSFTPPQNAYQTRSVE